jgi:transposase
MTDILNLKYLRVCEITDSEDLYQITVQGVVESTVCPDCKSGLFGHGSKPQRFMDTPIHGKRVILNIDRKRYRCKECGKTSLETLPEIDAKRQATIRLVKHIEFHCLAKTFADISREVGVDSKTIRHIFDDYVARLKETVRFQTPRILGIDELKIVGHYRAMLTNVEALSLFDMLPTRNKADLTPYFKKIPNKERIEIVTMDMWRPYKQVVQEQLPGRLIVVDRFHVVRMANNAIEAVRKTIRKGLDTRTRIKLKDDRFVLLSRYSNLDSNQRGKLELWSKQFPLLGAAYVAKERFHDIYNQSNKRDAMRAAKDWQQSIDPSIAWAFHDLTVALSNWWDEIFSYYDFPITNGYTESINNLAKSMNRMGRGYSFEVIRARLLYDNDARKDNLTTIRKKPRRSEVDTSMMAKMTFASITEADEIIEYGPSISTLIKKLESGQFE